MAEYCHCNALKEGQSSYHLLLRENCSGWSIINQIPPKGRYVMNWKLLEHRCQCPQSSVLHCHGLRSCHTRRKPLLQKWHLNAGLKHVIFGQNDQKFVWRKKGEVLERHTHCQAWCSGPVLLTVELVLYKKANER